MKITQNDLRDEVKRLSRLVRRLLDALRERDRLLEQRIRIIRKLNKEMRAIKLGKPL